MQAATPTASTSSMHRHRAGPAVRLRPSVQVTVAVALALLPCLAAGAEAPATGTTTILLVRHAEKAGPSGDVPLSAAGRQRAIRLAEMLRDAEVRHIFTSDLTRTRQTAAPLARKLGVTPEPLAPGAVDPLVAKVRALPAGAVALVVHHSNTLPEIVQKLGGPKLTELGENEYDRLMVLTRAPDGSARLVTLRY
jgi:phosphohistidine phosphatase SixA